VWDASSPLVSIVTPSLNQGEFIEAAISSVLEQDYPKIEHLVVDGGSTDGTVDILRRYPHLRWVSEPDEGQAAAVNKGFRLATGTIFGWLNADDYYLPGAVTAAVETILATECGFVHGGWRRVAEDGTFLGDVPPRPFDLRHQLEIDNAVCQPGSFFTRDAYWGVGGLDESYRYAMDYELWLKLGESVSVRHVDRIQAAYRYHRDSKSVAEYDRFWPETRRASRAHGGRFLNPLLTTYWLPKKHPWLFRVLVAARLLRRGDSSTACAARSLRPPMHGECERYGRFGPGHRARLEPKRGRPSTSMPAPDRILRRGDRHRHRFERRHEGNR
jgi:glycosyltransferase involved in cell wall biosynthesis